MTQWFGIRLPVMMGVTFAAVGPMVAIASANPGQEGARMMFGAIAAAGIISIFFAPVVGKMLRFFPSVVTGTVILVIGVSLMPVGINWILYTCPSARPRRSWSIPRRQRGLSRPSPPAACLRA